MPRLYTLFTYYTAAGKKNVKFASRIVCLIFCVYQLFQSFNLIFFYSYFLFKLIFHNDFILYIIYKHTKSCIYFSYKYRLKYIYKRNEQKKQLLICHPQTYIYSTYIYMYVIKRDLNFYK